MWFDVVEDITKSKTFIIALHGGSHDSLTRLKSVEKFIRSSNIDRIKLLSLNSSIGTKVAETYGFGGGLIILRANKQIAWSWAENDMPKDSEIVYRYYQTG